ncbi:cell wall hydrolase [Oricola sp.]|uniref:cell wall hydrolase n=1 Tax=Oricola sp. TaxID=1979950 RepID=UPI003BAADC7B
MTFCFGHRFVSRIAGPSFLSAAFILSNPTTVALQDVSGLLIGEHTKAESWNTYLVTAAAGSVHKAEVSFGLDRIATGSVASSGIDAPGVGRVVLTPKSAPRAATPDEDRVNRAEKQGRIVAVTPAAPPKGFSAGSVLERQSSVLQPHENDGPLMAFARPEIGGEEIQIATAFHARTPVEKASRVPAMLADLVTSNKADSLATAYAPPKPGFAERSPFQSLLKTPEAPDEGRFIPPVSRKDHPWARDPLPAVVFTDKEQKCLAEGIYFEARGERVKGQAAVAQVILNRVRNPHFPDTICGVVYQNDHWRNRCQFSFACDGIRDRIGSKRHWKIAKDVSMAVTAGKIWLDEVGSSTHYHAVYVRPRWARSMQRKTRIGLHIFYRTYGGGWS